MEEVFAEWETIWLESLKKGDRNPVQLLRHPQGECDAAGRNRLTEGLK